MEATSQKLFRPTTKTKKPRRPHIEECTLAHIVVHILYITPAEYRIRYTLQILITQYVW